MPCLLPCGCEILPKTLQNLDVCCGHERNHAIPAIPQPFEVGYRKVNFYVACQPHVADGDLCRSFLPVTASVVSHITATT